MSEQDNVNPAEGATVPVPPLPANPPIDKGTWNLVNRTAIGVTVAFALIAGFLTWQLGQLLSGLADSGGGTGFDYLTTNNILADGDVPPETSMAVAMEHDFQTGRSGLLRSLIASRLYLQSASLLAGMGLMVMGGALIVARIREATQAKFDVNVTDAQGQKSSVELATTFPGVILALIGALTICVTMVSSVFNKIENADAALYFRPLVLSEANFRGSLEPSEPDVVSEADGTDENVGAFLDKITGED